MDNDSQGDAKMETASYTIGEFCRAHRISRAHYYDLKNEGSGPDELRLGRKVTISKEAAERWRRRMEAETAARIARDCGEI